MKKLILSLALLLTVFGGASFVNENVGDIAHEAEPSIFSHELTHEAEPSIFSIKLAHEAEPSIF
ncbi:hypothetical protein [Sediminibacillus sp. JSM 1682029]|uniref:hypothetical protein n=1 Tax=Sediminibacillus sp. JSM 1682029 TaxID=3229857 RepID=UPI0035258B26